MRQTLIAILLFTSITSFGQETNKWQLSLQLQPEMTFHKNQFSYRWKEKFTKGTFNFGVSSSLTYNINDRIFIETGVGFISRKLATRVFINQSLLPPPFLDSTKILYTAKSVALRLLQFPISIGANILRMSNAKVFVKGSWVSNCLLNAKYEVNNYPKFKKNYWQGYSLNAGAGIDYTLNDKLALTGSLMYSFINKVAKMNIFSARMKMELPMLAGVDIAELKRFLEESKSRIQRINDG